MYLYCIYAVNSKYLGSKPKTSFKEMGMRIGIDLTWSFSFDEIDIVIHSPRYQQMSAFSLFSREKEREYIQGSS